MKIKKNKLYLLLLSLLFLLFFIIRFHNLKVYHCNDYYYSQINPTDLAVVDFRKFLKSDITCLNHKCTDGLDHVKYR